MNTEEPPKLRIAILTTDVAGSKYLRDLIEWAIGQPRIQLVTLLATESAGADRLSARLARRLILAFDSVWLKKNTRHADHLHRVDLSTLGVDVAQITTVAASMDGSSLEAVSPSGFIKLDLDLIVKWGDGGVSTKNLPSRLGAISVAYPNNQTVTASDAGFWEAYRQQDATRFCINCESMRGGSTATRFRESIQTRHFYLLNQACLVERSLHHLKSEIQKIAVDRLLEPERSGLPEAGAPEGSPTLRHAFAYIFRMLRMRAHSTFNRLIGREKRWGVSYSLTNWRDTVMSNAHAIENPKGHFLADPFAIEFEGRKFCFVEDYDFSTALGSIAAYEIEGENNHFLGYALRESFHLSFPYLLRHQGSLYMIPETSEKREIRIYRCTEFPLQWELHKTLKHDVDAVDTMLFEHENKWWMFTNIDVSGSGDFGSELHLFSANSPDDDHWVPHPMNPVITDSTCARNGGILFENGKIFRVSQRQGYNQYGKASSIHEILILNQSNYAESLVQRIDPSFKPGAFGTHHFFSTGAVTTFDYVYRPARAFGR